jgi:hypothetical protein
MTTEQLDAYVQELYCQLNSKTVRTLSVA